jgi:hypothetical protein
MSRITPVVKNLPFALMTLAAFGAGTARLLAASCTSNTCGGCYSEVTGCHSCSASGCNVSGFACATSCVYCSGQDPVCT